MAYDELLAARIRALLEILPGLEEKRMFGGVGFLINGNMACGVHKVELIVRVGAENYPAALSRPHARPFDMTGKPMAGWVMVGQEGCSGKAKLKKWVDEGLAFAGSLPAK